ncbi:ABC transporter permease [Pollutibacter soli]|uniref:ABC transporter permease n=1 Tax=Pollutibacter soli TaxID=3034157 RepID=UPI0030133A5B
MYTPGKVSFKWLLLMAWRDSRRNRSRLFLFISSIILGIAALVSIYSLSDVLQSEIDEQAAALLGADLELSSGKAFSPEMLALADSLGKERSEQRSFTSMVLFPKNGGTRLTQVNALGGDFPYYGELETEPVSAARTFRTKQQALVDQTLLLQFDAKVGDSIKVGNVMFEIAGSLTGAPGRTGIATSVAPPVYIPLSYIDQTGLQQKGSRINYRQYIQFKNPVKIEETVENLRPRLNKEGINYDTVESQKKDSARSFNDVTRFLSLVGFIALLMGCIGVASAIHIYIKEKISTIAILRCLGAKSTHTFLIYLIQIIVIGLIGSIIGAFLGTIIQQFLPALLKDFLPVEIHPRISWSAIGQGIGLGLIISVLFALLPLINIRRISPLNTLRISLQPETWKDPFKWLVYLGIILFVFGFTYLLFGGLTPSLFFTLGLLAAFFILALMARTLTWTVRRFFPSGWPYVWRQGLANLYRPNNQTGILIVTIGLGTALICTMFFIQQILIKRVTMAAGKNQPNMVLFDIQSAQRNDVLQLTRSTGLEAEGTVPMVTMRLESVHGITAEILDKDTSIRMWRGIFNREFRVTFRDSITDSEKITAGKWSGRASPGSLPEVSVEERFAKQNSIALGDTLVWNVQGALLPVVVGSFREVDWNRIQTNFLVVFPVGVLEEAPQFHVLMTQVNSKEKSAQFQQAVVRQFPNVSIIDLGLILDILDQILTKIGFVIRFMAAFCMVTGIVVLISSVLISKYQRIQESVLLRTLGASRRQIFIITAIEYFFLGGLAALTGIFLSIVGSWALAKYVFETEFSPQLLPVVIVFLSVCALTVSIGLINSRFIVSKPPLEILRQEV